MARTMDSLATYGLLVAAGFVTYELGKVGDFGPTFQKAMTDIGNTIKGIGGGSSSGTGTGAGSGSTSGACSAASIAQWAQGIHLSTTVGQDFCNDFGRLPASLSDLTTWGQQKGYLVNGAWKI